MGACGGRRRRMGRAAGTLGAWSASPGSSADSSTGTSVMSSTRSTRVLDVVLVLGGVGIPGRLCPGRGGHPVEQLRGRPRGARLRRVRQAEEPTLRCRHASVDTLLASPCRRAAATIAALPGLSRHRAAGLADAAGIASGAGIGHGHARSPGALGDLAHIGGLGGVARRPGQEDRAATRTASCSSTRPGGPGRAAAAPSPRSSGCPRRARRLAGRGPRPAPRRGRPGSQCSATVRHRSRADDTAGRPGWPPDAPDRDVWRPRPRVPGTARPALSHPVR